MDVKSRTIFYLTAVFQVSINLGRENKGEGEKKSEERREMAPGCSTERRPLPPLTYQGREREPPFT